MKLFELKKKIKNGDIVNDNWIVVGLGIYDVFCHLIGNKYRRRFSFHPHGKVLVINKVSREGKMIYLRKRKRKAERV